MNTSSLDDGKVQDGEVGRQDDNMPVKVLIHEKNELRLRITGETHTALQILRDRLNNHKSVEYANYFPGHPDLDPPEFYIRTCLLYTSPSPRDATLSRMPSSA